MGWREREMLASFTILLHKLMRQIISLESFFLILQFHVQKYIITIGKKIDTHQFLTLFTIQVIYNLTLFVINFYAYKTTGKIKQNILHYCLFVIV